MTPAPLSHVSSANSSGVGPPPIISAWSNPLPDTYKILDDRRNLLNSKNNRFLEMHPNGTRGVERRTEYCILTILILNVSSPSLWGWKEQGLERGGKKRTLNRHPTNHPLHVIKGNKTNLYLCMDNNSVLYQSPTFNRQECAFRNEFNVNKYTDRYYRQVNKTSPKWYIGINKDGTARCGNVTGKNHKGANYARVSVGSERDHSTSPPFEETKKACCTTDKCKNRDTGKGRRRKSDTCYKKWCRRHRRKFFSLKLKDLKRYYNRCIKKVRRCPDKRKGR